MFLAAIFPDGGVRNWCQGFVACVWAAACLVCSRMAHIRIWSSVQLQVLRFNEPGTAILYMDNMCTAH